MEIIKINGREYEVIENINKCIDIEELEGKITDYFDDFDYIFGDYAYEKVRLKGFNDSKSKRANKINNIDILESYKRNFCGYGARTFLIKRVR